MVGQQQLRRLEEVEKTSALEIANGMMGSAEGRTRVGQRLEGREGYLASAGGERRIEFGVEVDCSRMSRIEEVEGWSSMVEEETVACGNFGVECVEARSTGSCERFDEVEIGRLRSGVEEASAGCSCERAEANEAEDKSEKETRLEFRSGSREPKACFVVVFNDSVQHIFARHGATVASRDFLQDPVQLRGQQYPELKSIEGCTSRFGANFTKPCKSLYTLFLERTLKKMGMIVLSIASEEKHALCKTECIENANLSMDRAATLNEHGRCCRSRYLDTGGSDSATAAQAISVRVPKGAMQHCRAGVKEAGEEADGSPSSGTGSTRFDDFICRVAIDLGSGTRRDTWRITEWGCGSLDTCTFY
ncbi:hypothetical protein M5K25_016404 [Dendrobium thyrsiflorum]|uniref:Uncharacterized protein n=1 Tax=Dendrobium thyrsiflorum TaxID=117978 RepID=A0ABD0UJM9_DENTH